MGFNSMKYENLFDLSEKVAIVIGGGGGLGKEIAIGLASFGAKIAVGDIDLEKAKGVAGELLSCDRPAIAVEVNITDLESNEALVEKALRKFNRIDILVNSAGTLLIKPAIEISKENWQRVIDLNLTGMFLTTQVVGRVMLRQRYGKIINISSVSGQVGNPEYAAYAASKGGVTLLTKSLAAEWCRFGVTVNAIGPAFTQTTLTAPYLQGGSLDLAKVIERIPMGRLGVPEDIVGAAVFLASDASRFVIGQTIFVDGGRTLY
jgi:NAD(P)-dependent dehydrogenase (short-subunit alcohol dehydrogenase family)